MENNQSYFNPLQSDELGQNGSPVKQNFENWFGASVARDGCGNPSIYFHGTSVEIEHFDPSHGEFGVHVGTYAQAESFATNPNDNIIPLFVALSNPIRLIDHGQWDAPNVWAAVVDLGIVEDANGETMDRLLSFDNASGSELVRDILGRKGYDGIIYLNRREGLSVEDESIVEGDINFSLESSDEEFSETIKSARDSIIVFSGSQLKSAIKNNGNYDSSVDNIYDGNDSLKTISKVKLKA